MSRWASNAVRRAWVRQEKQREADQKLRRAEKRLKEAEKWHEHACGELVCGYLIDIQRVFMG